MNSRALLREPPIAQVIAIAMLLWALVPTNPYDYYILLRVVVCGVSIYLAVRAHEMHKDGWVWVLGIMAVIYNPLLRVHLNRDIWSAVNVATIFIIAITVWTLRRNDTDRDKQP